MQVELLLFVCCCCSTLHIENAKCRKQTKYLLAFCCVCVCMHEHRIFATHAYILLFLLYAHLVHLHANARPQQQQQQTAALVRCVTAADDDDGRRNICRPYYPCFMHLYEFGYYGKLFRGHHTNTRTTHSARKHSTERM